MAQWFSGIAQWVEHYGISQWVEHYGIVGWLNGMGQNQKI